MVYFVYQEMFPTGEDKTEYRILSKDHISKIPFENHEILRISEEGLTLLAENAF